MAAEVQAEDVILSSRPASSQPAGLRAIFRGYWHFVLVVVLAVLLWLPRLGGPIDLRYDGGVYYLLGTSLAQGHGYRIPSEPGSPQALQYPPLLPAIVAVYQRALGTSDHLIVGPWLRKSYALLFIGYAVAVLALAKRFLSPGLALAAAALCLLHHQTIFLSDLLFAELPFGLLAVGFVLTVAEPSHPSRPWLREAASFALATAAFLLRTAGLALLAAWVLEALIRRRWRVALMRAALTLLPIIAWQTYVTRIRASDEYSRPAYAYQRAPYQYYNVSYAENALLVDPFRPELGRVNAGTVALRLTTNLPFLIQSMGQAVSTTKAQWRQLLRKTQNAVLGRVVIPLGVTIVPIYGFALLAIAGFFVLIGRRAWPTVLLLLGSVALVWTTPWPAQFSRYLAPLIAFLDICFVLALSRLNLALHKRQPSRVRALARAGLAGVLVLAFLMETYTGVRLFRERARPEGIVFQPGRGGAYRLFAHEKTWRSWEKTVDWIDRNAPQDSIVATTAPHFCYLLIGRRAVLPPMESNPARARQLLAAVPISYVIIDQLEFLDVARRYARPAVESSPPEWHVVNAVGRTRTFQRVIVP